jgi:dihydroorotate dehydrogenase
MGWPWAIGRRAFFAIDAERAHGVARALLGAPLPWSAIGAVHDEPGLRTEVAGLELRNPVGLAAGFDKACDRLEALGKLGFGYVVGGTVTRRPRSGNPRPRIARSPSHLAMVNAMGLPNPGAEAVARSLEGAPRTSSRWVSLADEETRDAVEALALVAPHVDAIELNASSPNAGWTHGAAHVAEIVNAFRSATDRPVFVKVPPFGAGEPERAGVLKMVAASLEAGASGITCGNTVPVSDARLSTGRGGLSGGPLTDRTPVMIRVVRDEIGEEIPVHACGGIFTASQARGCLDAGASTVQVYTGLIYRGPRMLADLTSGLRARS